MDTASIRYDVMSRLQMCRLVQQFTLSFESRALHCVAKISTGCVLTPPCRGSTAGRSGAERRSLIAGMSLIRPGQRAWSRALPALLDRENVLMPAASARAVTDLALTRLTSVETGARRRHEIGRTADREVHRWNRKLISLISFATARL